MISLNICKSVILRVILKYKNEYWHFIKYTALHCTPTVEINNMSLNILQ